MEWYAAVQIQTDTQVPDTNSSSQAAWCHDIISMWIEGNWPSYMGMTNQSGDAAIVSLMVCYMNAMWAPWDKATLDLQIKYLFLFWEHYTYFMWEWRCIPILDENHK